ncbi:SRPBCC family protein [Candidatus Neptunichlamydia sp. REUL1]|uniref:SRPBCC family protein n=1 Tax=Candidatus Neptunichlamydia sp. REUL1 TaxID=3064277 RepID=UPI002931D5B7|nr:SRPBCC family protein [Candidatus Neptunochlamydia sp. REUL1]
MTLFFEHTVTIRVTEQQVWAKLADVEAWPTWDNSLSWCRFSSPFQSGATGTLKPSSGPETDFELINVLANQIFDVRSKLPLGNKMIVGHQLRPCSTGTQLTHSIRFEGWLSCLFTRVIGKGLKASLPSAMDKLKANLENQGKVSEPQHGVGRRRSPSRGSKEYE